MEPEQEQVNPPVPRPGPDAAPSPYQGPKAQNKRGSPHKGGWVPLSPNHPGSPQKSQWGPQGRWGPAELRHWWWCGGVGAWMIEACGVGAEF